MNEGWVLSGGTPVDTIIAQQILHLKSKDDALLQSLRSHGSLSDGYHPDLRALHTTNIHALMTIWDAHGFPGISNVGEKAYEAAFVIVQHAIDHPKILKKYAKELFKAAQAGDAKMIHYAYLSDRIAVFEGRNQVYATQFDWDEAGLLSPQGPYAVKAVNEKRAEVGLNPIEDQIEKMREQAQKYGQKPPKDPHAKRAAYEAWRREVGWI